MQRKQRKRRNTQVGRGKSGDNCRGTGEKVIKRDEWNRNNGGRREREGNAEEVQSEKE